MVLRVLCRWAAAASTPTTGRVPVPAPATARLLEGMPLHDDGIPGERITPTGAAILRHLGCRFGGGATGRLTRTGTGLGTKPLPNTLNALRVVVMEPPVTGRVIQTERLVRAALDVDDQTPEDVAVAVDRLRATASVVDVTSAFVQGKKGRLSLRLDLLAEPGCCLGCWKPASRRQQHSASVTTTFTAPSCRATTKRWKRNPARYG